MNDQLKWIYANIVYYEVSYGSVPFTHRLEYRQGGLIKIISGRSFQDCVENAMAGKL